MDWNSGRFHINADQLATPTDRMLVCGVKKYDVGRGSAPVVDAPLVEVPLVEPIAELLEGPFVLRSARPTTAIATLVFFIGGVLGFGAVATWPLWT